MLHKFDYRKNLEEFADEVWIKHNDENSWTRTVHERMSIINFGTEQQEILQKGQRTYLEEQNQKKLQNPHLNLNIQMRQIRKYKGGQIRETTSRRVRILHLIEEIKYLNLICIWQESKGSIHRLDGPARIDHAKNSRRWYCHGRLATKIYKIPGVLKPFKKGNKVGLVLKHVEGPFYEALIGNKKKLIVDAYDYDIKLKKDSWSRNYYKTNYDQNLIDPK